MLIYCLDQIKVWPKSDRLDLFLRLCIANTNWLIPCKPYSREKQHTLCSHAVVYYQDVDKDINLVLEMTGFVP